MTPLRLELAHAPASAAEARAAVRAHLEAAGLGAGTGEAVDDAVLVTSELVTNAVRHGARPVMLTLLLGDDGGVVVEVSDGGTWRTDPPVEGGRGLPLVRALSRQLDIDTAGGTTVTAHLPR